MPHTRKKSFTFGLDDYNSNDGMLTSVWGPGMWHYLHTMSFNYPVNPCPEDKKHYMDFVKSLVHVLPCGKCRKNLRKNFAKLPLTRKDMQNRDTFSRYVYKLHETVNKMLGKNSGLTFEEVRERYEHFRARCAKSTTKFTTKFTTNKFTTKFTTKSMADKFTTKKSIKQCTRKKKAIESGCTEPLYGEKSKCVLHIVPQTEKCDTLQIDNKCVKKNMKTILQERDAEQIS